MKLNAMFVRVVESLKGNREPEAVTDLFDNSPTAGLNEYMKEVVKIGKYDGLPIRLYIAVNSWIAEGASLELTPTECSNLVKARLDRLNKTYIEKESSCTHICNSAYRAENIHIDFQGYEKAILNIDQVPEEGIVLHTPENFFDIYTLELFIGDTKRDVNPVECTALKILQPDKRESSWRMLFTAKSETVNN